VKCNNQYTWHRDELECKREVESHVRNHVVMLPTGSSLSMWCGKVSHVV
jgi:hypothetical protein